MIWANESIVTILKLAGSAFALSVVLSIRRHAKRDRLSRTVTEPAPAWEEANDFPALTNMLRGYFHQDYDLVMSEDPDEVVAIFANENGKDHVKNVIDNIDRFIIRYGETDLALEQAFIRVFRPEAMIIGWKGRSAHEAFSKAIDLLRAGLTEKLVTKDNAEPESADTYPGLQNLIRGYFHQDCDIVSEDPDEIVAQYKRENLPGNRKILINDVHRFLYRHRDETDEQLERTLRNVFTPDFGFHCWNGRTTREALAQILHILSDSSYEGLALR